MDNRAYEKYRAEHPEPQHTTVVQPAEVDFFDGNYTNTEIGILSVAGLLVLWAIYKIVTGKK